MVPAEPPDVAPRTPAPPDPVHLLAREHRVILRALDALERFAEELASGVGDPAELGDFVAFFRGFVDVAHHRKEESILFGSLAQQGVLTADGELSRLQAEHDALRHGIDRLAGLGASGPWTASARSQVVEEVGEYAARFRRLLEHEQRDVLPRIRGAVEPEVYARIADAFEDFERTQTAVGEHERLHRLAYDLLERHAWLTSGSGRGRRT